MCAVRARGGSTRETRGAEAMLSEGGGLVDCGDSRWIQSVVLSYLFIYLLLLLTGSNLLTDVLTDIAMRRLAKNRSCAKEQELH